MFKLKTTKLCQDEDESMVDDMDVEANRWQLYH
jgi:hypothetical protein